jgi:hypothetical protein
MFRLRSVTVIGVTHAGLSRPGRFTLCRPAFVCASTLASGYLLNRSPRGRRRITLEQYQPGSTREAISG